MRLLAALDEANRRSIWEQAEQLAIHAVEGLPSTRLARPNRLTVQLYVTAFCTLLIFYLGISPSVVKNFIAAFLGALGLAV